MMEGRRVYEQNSVPALYQEAGNVKRSKGDRRVGICVIVAAAAKLVQARRDVSHQLTVYEDL